MKRMLMLAIVVLVASSAMAAPVLEIPGLPSGSMGASSREEISGFHFDTDNEGWQMAYFGDAPGSTYDTLYPNEPALWSSSLGDPVGSVFQTVTDGVSQRAYWMGYIGDNGFMGDLNNQMIQCNVYSTANWTTISGLHGGSGGDDGNVYARWVVARESDAGGAWAMYISNQSVSLDMNTFTGWEVFAVDVTESNFSRWPNSPDPSQSFMQVMSDYDQIGLYIFSGTDDMDDVNGGGTSWVTHEGTSRLQHYGAMATSGDATWAVDNPTVGDGVVSTQSTTFGGIKALFR